MSARMRGTRVKGWRYSVGDELMSKLLHLRLSFRPMDRRYPVMFNNRTLFIQSSPHKPYTSTSSFKLSTVRLVILVQHPTLYNSKTDKMASLFRPTLLRQACTAQRLATTAAPPAIIRPSTLAFGNSTYQMTPARVAAFHATTKRQILPPLPRTPQEPNIQDAKANDLSRKARRNW